MLVSRCRPDGYRLWCTFEAIAVEHRNLQVGIAGYGMSSTQRHVLHFGSLCFWFWGGDGVLDELAYMNASFYIMMLATLAVVSSEDESNSCSRGAATNHSTAC